jgi:hypothetical protein
VPPKSKVPEARYYDGRFIGANSSRLAKIFHASVLMKDHVRAAGYPLNTRSKAKFSGLNLLLVWLERAPTNSEQKVTKRTKFLSDEPYNLRFLRFQPVGLTARRRFLLFMISAPSVLSAVTPSVAAKPRSEIRGQIKSCRLPWGMSHVQQALGRQTADLRKRGQEILSRDVLVY